MTTTDTATTETPAPIGTARIRLTILVREYDETSDPIPLYADTADGWTLTGLRQLCRSIWDETTTVFSMTIGGRTVWYNPALIVSAEVIE